MPADCLEQNYADHNEFNFQSLQNAGPFLGKVDRSEKRFSIRWHSSQ